MHNVAYQLGLVGMALLLMPVVVVSGQTHALDSHFDGVRNSCYQRTYSDEHLRRHPKQTVARVSFEHYPRHIGEFDDNDEIKFNEKTRDIYFVISVKFRNNNKMFEESGVCTREGDLLQCGIECDGGGFNLIARAGGKLLLKTADIGFRVVAQGSGCGDEPGEDNLAFITRKSDDKAFLLSLAPAHQCMVPASLIQE